MSDKFTVSNNNRKYLNWFNFYGMLRMLGSEPGPVAYACNVGDSAAEELMEALQLASSKDIVINQAITGGVTSVFGIIGSAVGGMGQFVAILGGLFIKLANAINQRQYPIGCNETCSGNVSYDRRYLIGIHMPPGRRSPGSMTIVRFLHDGLIYNEDHGPLRTVNEQHPGCGAGVHGVAYTYNTARRTFQNKEQYTGWMKYDRRPPLPEGSKSDPWKNGSVNTYWYRKWAVTRLLLWLQEAVPCTTLICLNTVGQAAERLNLDPNGDRGDPPHSSIDQKVGSLWFASVYYMHKDFNDLATAKGASNVQSILSKIGASSAAAAVATRSQGGSQEHPYNWSWYPVSKKLSFAQLQQMLGLLSMQTATISPLALSVLQQGGFQPQQTATISPLALSLLQHGKFQSSVNPLLLLGGLSAGALLLYALLKR